MYIYKMKPLLYLIYCRRPLLGAFKINFHVLWLWFFSSILFSQNYNIGHTSANFYDDIRGRTVSSEIYYPSNIDGEDAPIYPDMFPLIVFGHGFLMSWDAYENFWSSLVPEGYILCFPTTEMGFVPNHQDFAEDLSFLITQMQSESEKGSSIFYNSIMAKTAIMGHSMGGGASFLAAENNPNITTLINFAAAETVPSAISATSGVVVPSLLFSGEDDCVSPPTINQDIMFENLSSNCKTQINILNGGHCYFANQNPFCDFGESFCNPNLSITPNEQQDITTDFLRIWLNIYLKSDQSYLSVFNDSLQLSNRISYSQYCNNFIMEDNIIEADILLTTDMLGRVTSRPGVQLDIYNDGTVKKRRVIK